MVDNISFYFALGPIITISTASATNNLSGDDKINERDLNQAGPAQVK